MSNNSFHINALEERIFQIKSESEFQQLCLEVFQFQYETNQVYKKYCDLIGRSPNKLSHWTSIPFLPIQFFKSEEVKSGDFQAEAIFKSSGTGGQRSEHQVKDLDLYRKSFSSAFHQFYGDASSYCILALLPSYLEQGDSSLVFMCDHLIRESQYDQSGFFLNDQEGLVSALELMKKDNIPTILIGVSYALLDLVEAHRLNFPDLIVMETGGMKGRKREMIRSELHAELTNGFKVNQIHSEYGMTELLSQAYSKEKGQFQCPPWMRVTVRSQEDPLSFVKEGQTGGLNIIDLANLHSCSFIQTDDLGRHNGVHFEVLGRFDHAEARGCNLLLNAS